MLFILCISFYVHMTLSSLWSIGTPNHGWWHGITVILIHASLLFILLFITDLFFLLSTPTYEFVLQGFCTSLFVQSSTVNPLLRMGMLLTNWCRTSSLVRMYQILTIYNTIQIPYTFHLCPLYQRQATANACIVLGVFVCCSLMRHLPLTKMDDGR